MKVYRAPDDIEVVTNPTETQLIQTLREQPHSYWLQGGNGEASLEADGGDPALWIKQPEPGRFFLTFSSGRDAWLVPFDGGTCDMLVEDERGGDPFWIPRACLIDVEDAVEAVIWFLTHTSPSPKLVWRFWHQLPLSDDYPKP
jgi:hypothetical protein